MTETQRWGTRVGLVLAMAGNAVGLGNFLRFPAQAAQNGGGAFLIPYLISFVFMGIPLLWVEWAIGRHGGQFGHHSGPGMFDRLGRQRWLKYVGVFGLFTNLTIAAYYCYIESWTVAYVFHSIGGTFKSTDPKTFFPHYLGVHESSLFALPGEALAFFTITLALNTFILSRGLAKGIEVAAKIGMPLLLIFAAALAIRGLTLGSHAPAVVQSPLDGLNFVWNPNLSGLGNPTTWMAAAGQVFFTLSLGMGSIHCYASYLRRDQDLALNASAAGWINEFVEVILGGTILIPIATAYLGLSAVQAATSGGSGFGLGFLTLPTLFNNWGWFAPIAGAMWFGLLFFAGITSSLAMGQPLLAFLEDEFKITRARAALLFGAVTFALGFVCVWLYPGGAFDEFDFWTGTFALVIFALFESIIFAFVFGMDKGWDEITRGAEMKVPQAFRFIIQWVTPAFITVVFVGALIQPVDGKWGHALASLFGGHGWPLAPGSVIGKIFHIGGSYAWRGPDGRLTAEFVQDATRLLLLLVFVAISLLVAIAWRRKARAAHPGTGHGRGHA
ncbi:MAG: sodium-dependent transporter [Candidatus Eisenbacteria bacterium]|uniref:Sodium-dependent transporter n=1 Tax=Eiseniibacteriota bacterium TaxID=2212470 RepID=A0A956RNM3_UNCEI|nr:sodium-dependent transporter [Candidatus Eisenbacteria bacterium]